MWRNHLPIWIKTTGINRFDLLLKCKLTWLYNRIRMLLLVVHHLLCLIHLMMMISHLNWLHHRSPFRDWLLNMLNKMMIGISYMGVDMLFHAGTIVVVHHNWDWMNLHDRRAFFACFSHAYCLLSICFDAVRHLVMIGIAELILLWRDVILNTGSVCAVQCIYLIEIGVVFHLIGQHGSVR